MDRKLARCSHLRDDPNRLLAFSGFPLVGLKSADILGFQRRRRAVVGVYLHAYFRTGSTEQPEVAV